jgi:hypothetical protein
VVPRDFGRLHRSSPEPDIDPGRESVAGGGCTSLRVGTETPVPAAQTGHRRENSGHWRENSGRWRNRCVRGREILDAGGGIQDIGGGIQDTGRGIQDIGGADASAARKFWTLAAPMRSLPENSGRRRGRSVPGRGNSGRGRRRCVRCRKILDVGATFRSSVAGIQDAAAADAFAARKFWTLAEPFGLRSREFWTLAPPMRSLPEKFWMSARPFGSRSREFCTLPKDSNPVYLATLVLTILQL